ncbi:MAG: HD domain-containing protein [Actinobacteria bacterium]|nr:HD domain-containing protein [Actinomycetota bacterium]
MTNPVGRLAQVFEQAGFQLYLVGGPVRDRLMGRSSQDLDLTTDARPANIKLLIARAGADDVYTVGEKFGTIGAIFEGARVEVTTFRSDTYSPGSRKPDVEFGHSLEGDLGRRDFTVNAIAQDVRTGKIIDPFGGVGDITLRLIRAVGVADQRFDEDPLRLLRAVRFATQLHFDLDRDTAAAIRRNAARLRHISAERIGAELQLMLLARRPEAAIKAMLEFGLLNFVLPELLPLQTTVQDERLEHKDVFAHTLRVLGVTAPVPELRWAALLHDVGKPQTKSVRAGRIRFYGHEDVGADLTRAILKRLRYDARLVERVEHIVRLHMRANAYASDWTDGAVRRFIREAGEDLEHLIALSRADITSYRPRRVEAGLARVAELQARCEMLDAEEDVATLASPLDGHGLMLLFDRPAGPWIKPIKDHLLDLVLDGQLAPDDVEGARREALAFAARPASTAATSAAVDAS